MSGISTETNRFVDALGKYGSFTTIACTRKTAPGLRYFDKKAVVLGGGSTHRMRLDDMVLIKDNHLAIANSVTQSINMAKKSAGSSIKIECEAKNKKEAIEAINAGADIVMLDNFSPSKAYNTIKSIEKMGARKRVKIEISGGINIKNIKQYVKAKPDLISIGYLTHSARAVDFSLDLFRLKSDKN
jgi:nicotinate-nucleotide pyrophosphorylase (carboxylating)